MSGELYEYLRECKRSCCLSYLGENCSCGRQEALEEYAELLRRLEKYEKRKSPDSYSSCTSCDPVDMPLCEKCIGA